MSILRRGRGRGGNSRRIVFPTNNLSYADQGPVSVDFEVAQLQTGAVHGRPTTLGCMQWSLTVSKQDGMRYGPTAVNVTINCMQNASALANFYCDTDILVRVLPNVPYADQRKLWEEQEQLMNESGRYTIEAWLQISRVKYDLTTENEFAIGGDAIIIVGGRKFHVDKAYLSVHAPYFDRLFYGTFNEAAKNEVTLNDIEPEDFMKFLQAIYPSTKNSVTTVTGDNVMALTELADQFNATALLAKCQEFLCSKESETHINNHEKFKLADQRNLDQVKLHVLKHVVTMFGLEIITKPPYDWSPATLEMLQRKEAALKSSANDYLWIVDE